MLVREWKVKYLQNPGQMGGIARMGTNGHGQKWAKWLKNQNCLSISYSIN